MKHKPAETHQQVLQSIGVRDEGTARLFLANHGARLHVAQNIHASFQAVYPHLLKIAAPKPAN